MGIRRSMEKQGGFFEAFAIDAISCVSPDSLGIKKRPSVSQQGHDI
jgi:hypothetical protein